MNITNINGANAYANAPQLTPPVDNTQLKEQNIQASRSDLETQDTATGAFELSITQEARDRAATENTDQQNTTQTPPEDTAQTVVPAQDASQIVNIVA